MLTRIFLNVNAILFFIFLISCSISDQKKKYLTAEKLWTEGKYKSAINKFLEIHKQNPETELGVKSLFRAAMTESVFLSNHLEAIKKFKLFIKYSKNEIDKQIAQREIGDIFLNKLKHYGEALLHYKELLDNDMSKNDRQKTLLRIAQAHFFLREFDEALKAFEEVIKIDSKTNESEEAKFKLAVTYFTSGGTNRSSKEKEMASYYKAISAYKSFINSYPNSEKKIEALFGLASTYEEIDELDLAVEIYESIKEFYPSPNVILIRLERLRERHSNRTGLSSEKRK